MRYLINLATAYFIFYTFFMSNAHAALTLEQAWYQAKNKNPVIDSSHAQMCAAVGQQIQASLLPNPTINIVQGSVPGFGKYSQNPNASSTYTINQMIEIGGKRRARQDVANAQYDETVVAYAFNSADLFSQTVNAFLAVAEAEAKLRLSEQGISISQKTINTIVNRINAGRTSELDLNTAQIAFNDQKLVVASIKNEIDSSKFTLSRLWNGSVNDVHKIIVPSFKTMPLHSLSFYLDRIHENLELKSFSQAEEVAKNQIKLAQAKQYPDISIGGGIEHFYENSEPKSHNAVILELIVPIPIFDRNQGNVVSALENYRKSLDNSQSKKLSLQSAIVKTYKIASQALLQINTIKKEILPKSLHSLKLARHGYEQGRFSYLDLLNAQQKLLDAQMREVTALFLYFRAWYVLQILSGALPQGNSL